MSISPSVRKAVLALAAAPLALPPLLGSGSAAQAASVTTWDKVANCESGGNWSINSGNGFYGGLQFTAGTWNSYGGTGYAVRADLATKQQQILIAEKVLASQGQGAWPTCGPQAGLGNDHADPYPPASTHADISGDGKADLMVLSTDGTIGLRGGSGTSFGASTTVSAGWQNFLGGAGQGRLYYADIDGDGRKDLLVHGTDGAIGVHFNNGSGTSFGANVPISSGWQNYLGQPGQGRLSFPDINGDGKADLVIQGTDGTIATHLGSGTSFGANLPLSSGWQNYLSQAGQGRLSFPDINGDGKADLVIQGTDGTIATHLGSGTSFGANLPLSAGWQNYLSQPGQGRLYYADINGDGKADLIIQGTDGTVATHLGSGTSFGANLPLSAGWQNYLSQPGQGSLSFE
ncbi:transglycosylase family protein [Streptomyces sp. NBC_00073]|uniref:transglycosylase family protein n=1 Tax=Streptomyces sp. NBC_00073 TaxID=2975640 RepID=UPI002F913BED